MGKTELWVSIALLAGVETPAVASECLNQIDGLAVQYDLPAGPGYAGTQISAPPAPAGGPEMSAQSNPSGTTLPPAAGLPVLNPLTEAQRAQLESILRDARAADATSDEAKCVDLLHRAQAIMAKHP